MSNFTDFFPAASGGGGGFTKQLKWTTARGLDDANYNDAASYTVNPATDLGLEDGASIGYMLVGSGQDYIAAYQGGAGGRIIQGTSIISSASTDLVLTPGTGNNVASTISGGLTLTSANGVALFGGTSSGTNFSSSASSGVMGYSAGGAGDFNRGMGVQGTFHGWGNGGGESSSSGDGAILLFY